MRSSRSRSNAAFPSNVVYVADGTKPMDATLLGGVVARATGMLVLAPTPLHQTAAGQAANFGLTGISRFYPARTRCGRPAAATATATAATTAAAAAAAAAAPPPPPPVVPPPPPPPPVPPDTTPPSATLSGATTQKLGRTVSIGVICTSEPCTAAVRATIAVPKVGSRSAKTYTLKRVSAKLAKGSKRTFRLAISAAARARIQRALRARKSVSAKFTVTVTDGAGNKRDLKRTVKFKR